MIYEIYLVIKRWTSRLTLKERHFISIILLISLAANPYAFERSSLVLKMGILRNDEEKH